MESVHQEFVTYALIFICVALAMALFLLWRKFTEHQKRLKQLSTENNLAQVIQMHSHDLRSPFAQVMTALSFGTEGYSLEEMATFNSLIQSKAEQGLHEIDNILLWAKCQESGAKTLQLQKVDLCELIEEALQLMRGISKEKNVEILTQTASGQFSTNPSLLAQAIRNIVSNALRHSLSNSKVTITGKLTKEVVTIDIKDTDGSISTDVLAQLNQPVNNLASMQSTHDTRGLEMDLFFSRVFINSLGGQLTFTSNKKNGTEAKIQLPLT